MDVGPSRGTRDRGGFICSGVSPGEDRMEESPVSVSPTPPRTTKRLPGRWSELTVTGSDLVPEVSTTLPWLSAEDFERVVQRATEGAGFSFEHDLERRPDVVLGERDIGLDPSQTRRSLLLGIGLGVGGLLVLAMGFLFLLPVGGGFGPILLLEVVGASAAVSGLTVATQSRWESDLLRVRLYPPSTRVRGGGAFPSGNRPPLSVRVFLGRVTSSSTSSRGGTFRSLRRVLPAPALSGEASEIASRLVQVAQGWTPSLPSGSPLPRDRPPVPARPRPSHLLPLAYQSARPEWHDYPRWFVWLRVFALIVPMVLLMFGPMLLLLPWNYQRVDFTPGGPSTQSIPGESWSPTGATSGEVWWYTYDPATAAEVNNVPVVVALCPIGTVTVDPGACRSVDGSSFAPATQGDYPISIPVGWHLVANVTVSGICPGCHTSVRFSSPEMALGFGLTLAGVGVLVPSVALWLRTRSRVSSAWPG